MIHDRRTAGDYSGWGLHVWRDANEPDVTWLNPLQPAGTAVIGIFWKVRLNPNPTRTSYIIHKGEPRTPAPINPWSSPIGDTRSGRSRARARNTSLPAIAIALAFRGGKVGDLNKQQAHWVSRDTIAWKVASPGTKVYKLYYDANGGLELKSYRYHRW